MLHRKTGPQLAESIPPLVSDLELIHYVTSATNVFKFRNITSAELASV